MLVLTIPVGAIPRNPFQLGSALATFSPSSINMPQPSAAFFTRIILERTRLTRALPSLLFCSLLISAVLFVVKREANASDTSSSSQPEIVDFSIRTPIERRFLKVVPTGKNYYVSTKGNDRNPGTIEKPFRRIQRFADLAEPGDTCYVREGTYRETVRPKRGGKQRNPIVYVAYPGEKVVLSGTEPITGKWSVYRDSIYHIKVDRDMEQLFVNGEMMTEARWPNRP